MRFNSKCPLIYPDIKKRNFLCRKFKPLTTTTLRLRARTWQAKLRFCEYARRRPSGQVPAAPPLCGPACLSSKWFVGSQKNSVHTLFFYLLLPILYLLCVLLGLLLLLSLLLLVLLPSYLKPELPLVWLLLSLLLVVVFLGSAVFFVGVKENPQKRNRQRKKAGSGPPLPHPPHLYSAPHFATETSISPLRSERAAGGDV